MLRVDSTVEIGGLGDGALLVHHRGEYGDDVFRQYRSVDAVLELAIHLPVYKILHVTTQGIVAECEIRMEYGKLDIYRKVKSQKEEQLEFDFNETKEEDENEI